MNPKHYSLQDYRFVTLSKQSKDPKEKQRYLILANIKDGKEHPVIADTFKVSLSTVKRTLRRFRQSGVSDLKDRARSGAPSKLTEAQLLELKDIVLAQQQARAGGRLTGYDIQALLAEKYQVSYALSTTYTLLEKLNLSWISSRSRHPKQSQQLQTDLKNFSEAVLASLPDDTKPDQVDIWFQDETRVGQQGSITRIWAEKGTRPRAVRQQQFEYSYIYGAVCPSTGQSVGLILPCVNMIAMTAHLEAISQQVPEGRHAIIIVDGAAWHSAKLNLHNITLLKLPPYSPELNPVEQVWLWLKQKWLSNRVYENYEAIVDACCHAWNQFADNEALVSRLCTRQWANLKES